MPKGLPVRICVWTAAVWTFQQHPFMFAQLIVAKLKQVSSVEITFSSTESVQTSYEGGVISRLHESTIKQVKRVPTTIRCPSPSSAYQGTTPFFASIFLWSIESLYVGKSMAFLSNTAKVSR